MAEQRLTLITYDIADDGRRLRLSERLEDFGDRVQYSVFEAFLTSSQRDRLEEIVEALIEPGEDSVRFYDLGRLTPGEVEVIGDGEPPEAEDNFVII